MQKINRFLITMIQMLSLYDSTKQSNIKQTTTTLKAIVKTLKNPVFKKIGNTINNSMGMFHQKKNAVKSFALGLEKQARKYLKTSYNFRSKPIKYLGEARQGEKYKASWLVSENKRLIKRSAEQIGGKELISLVNKISRSKTQLPFVFGTTSLGLVSQLNSDLKPHQFDDKQPGTDMLADTSPKIEEKLTLERLVKNSKELGEIVKKRFIYGQSFDIYQGIGGHSFASLYDYGPVGCSIKNNLLKLWRDHFILEEDMLEIATPVITPDIVFESSGHKQKFLDFIVQDMTTNVAYRADHAQENWAEKEIKENIKLTDEKKQELELFSIKAGSMNKEELQDIFTKHDVKNYENGNNFGEVRPFNLMFQSLMGPTGESPVFLRPETAQGIFVNFPKLLRCNNNSLPFGAATIGMGYRNEIAPKQKLIRVREFDLAEIEYFYDPEVKTHSRFSEISDMVLPLYSAEDQELGKKEWKTYSIKSAVESNMIDSENLAYFMGRTLQFLEQVGLDLDGVRFRQHGRKEMAHYAKDCWDAEILTSYGWIECVGIADRSAFDLKAHAEGTKKPIVASRILDPPKKEKQITVKLDQGKVGRHFRQDSRNISEHFAEMTKENKQKFKEVIENGETYNFVDCKGKEFGITKDFVKEFIQKDANISVETYVPYVIEPSFGIGRILFALLEHSYKRREERNILHFKPYMAPVKVNIFPIFAKDEFMSFLPILEKKIKAYGLSTKCDRTSVSIGRKYARNDEIGIPYAITIDHITKDETENKTVTLREMLTTNQVRIPIEEIGQVLANLCNSITPWADVYEKYPNMESDAS